MHDLSPVDSLLPNLMAPLNARHLQVRANLIPNTVKLFMSNPRAGKITDKYSQIPAATARYQLAAYPFTCTEKLISNIKI